MKNREKRQKSNWDLYSLRFGSNSSKIPFMPSSVFDDQNIKAARLDLSNAGNIYGRLTNSMVDDWTENSGPEWRRMENWYCARSRLSPTPSRTKQKQGDYIVSAKIRGSREPAEHTPTRLWIETTFVDIFTRGPSRTRNIILLRRLEILKSGSVILRLLKADSMPIKSLVVEDNIVGTSAPLHTGPILRYIPPFIGGHGTVDAENSTEASGGVFFLRNPTSYHG